MKRCKILIALVFMFGVSGYARAQYFDWVQGFTSCAYYAQSQVERAVADSEGNIYFLAHIRHGAEIDGEELLPEGIGFYQSICLVKLSPDGHMLWHKALGKTRANILAANLLMVGDSMLAFMGYPSFSPFRADSNQLTYYWDTLMQGAPYKTDSVNGGACAAVIYFNFDGSIKEQHFLNVGYNDTAGNPIYSDWPVVASAPFAGEPVFSVDNEGNVIIVASQFETSDWDPVTRTSKWYRWENGNIGAFRLMVDGERSFYVHSRSCPRFWNYLIMKFSPHFDSLLAARFLFEPFNTPIDFDRGSITVPPEDPSFPMDEYRSYMCNENTILESFEIDEENNIYLIGLFDRSPYCCTDTVIPVDSAAGIYLTLKMIPSNISTANYCTLPREGYLIKFDPQLRPQYLKQLDYPKRGKTITTFFYHPNVTDSGMIVPISFCTGSVSDPNPDKYFSYDGDTLPLWLNKSAAFLRLDKGDGHLLAYGGLHVKGDWQFRCAVHDKSGMYFSTYAAENNRFASGIYSEGDILFNDSLHHYNFRGYLERVSAVSIWDYSGHEILYIELSGLDSNDRRIGGALFSDSSLYIYGRVSNTTLHFGDLLLDARHGDGCTTAFIARYVDTAFLRPYVYVPPETQEPEDIRVLVQDDIGCVTVYPNPFRQRVRVRYKGEERLREAYLTDMAGRRETVTLVPCGEGEWSVDFAHLPPAPYLLTLVTDSGKQITARLSRAK